MGGWRPKGATYAVERAGRTTSTGGSKSDAMTASLLPGESAQHEHRNSVKQRLFGVSLKQLLRAGWLLTVQRCKQKIHWRGDEQ
jgi:hypothetical protein